MSEQYEVLNPWAEVDPIPLRGISPRVTDLNNKTIGLFVNRKVAAAPTQMVVEEKLKERFPTLKFNSFVFGRDEEIAQAKERAQFEEWVKGVDTVIAAVGD
ncbi:hypothetical protein ACFLXD_00750 [Chloroflexota bacterium]